MEMTYKSLNYSVLFSKREMIATDAEHQGDTRPGLLGMQLTNYSVLLPLSKKAPCMTEGWMVAC